jgi:membrane-associated protease RseP (regulator of RpoE activity)
MIVTLLGLVVALSILVFAHELGHYVAAKLSNVVVEEFGLGYPPRLFAFWHTRGKIVIGGQEIVIPRNFRVPEGLGSGSRVIY